MHHKNHVKNGDMIECWTGLSYIASITENIKMASFVSPASFRHPGILANMATTVDEISKGRLILGIGAGWQENEHNAYGFDLLSPSERINRCEEGIECIIGLLNNEKFSFNGNYFNFNEATCFPKKYKDSIPLMIGCWSGNNKMLNLGKKYGNIINLIGDPIFLYNKLDDEFKEDTRFKNVLHHTILVDDYTKPLLSEYFEDPKNKYKPVALGNYDLISLDVFKKYIKIYKKMNFSEIIIGDASSFKNEKYFKIITHMKKIIENES
jgi:hypothetical protein